MVVMKCIAVTCNNRNEIVGYTLEDTAHNKRVLTPAELRLVLQSKKGICLNVGLMPNGELKYSPLVSQQMPAKPKGTGLTGTKISCVTETNASRCRTLMMRNKLMGREDAIYEIENIDKVVLKKVLIQEGEYTIPEFVTSFAVGPMGQRQVRGVFADCKRLKVRNNSRSIKDYDHIFGYCPYLKELDLSEFSTVGATSMNGMFYNALFLQNLDLHTLDTSKVEFMEQMFYYCAALQDLDLSSFDTSNVISMSAMFQNCDHLKRLNLSSFNTSKVLIMSGMFESCSALIVLDLSNFDTHTVTDMMDMFSNCRSLTKLDLRNFNTAKVGVMCSMFSGCLGLKDLDISSFDTSKVYNMAGMFRDCCSLKSLDISHFNLISLKNARSMFEGMKAGTVIFGNNEAALRIKGANPELDKLKFTESELWHTHRRIT